MNIAIINNLYEPFNRGGAEKIAKIQSEGLIKKGHKVIIISLKPFFAANPDKPGHYYLGSFFPSLNKIPKSLRLLWHLFDTFDFINYIRIRKILKDNDIECVLSHNLCGIGKPIMLQMSKYNNIHTLHDISLLHPSGLMYYGKEAIIDTPFAKLYQSINRFFLKNTRTVISPSSWLLETHATKGFFENAARTVILNPTTITKKNNGQRGANANIGLSFLYVGLISVHKGLKILLDAWNTAKKGEKDILNLVGECDDKELLEKIKKTEQVCYLGKKNTEDVAGLMSQADCLIVPSICYENSPSVIYEAVASKLPFIASRTGGNIELAQLFGGLTFMPTAKELKKLIEKIIGDPNALNALKTETVNELSTDSYISKIEQLIIGH